jgi:hypothetical protein
MELSGIVKRLGYCNASAPNEISAPHAARPSQSSSEVAIRLLDSASSCTHSSSTSNPLAQHLYGLLGAFLGNRPCPSSCHALGNWGINFSTFQLFRVKKSKKSEKVCVSIQDNAQPNFSTFSHFLLFRQNDQFQLLAKCRLLFDFSNFFHLYELAYAKKKFCVRFAMWEVQSGTFTLGKAENPYEYHYLSELL